MTATPTVEQVLECPMGENDAHAKTVRDYLGTLLLTLWIEEQGFSGKRPFGNSSWQHEVYVALAENALIEASKDEWNEWDYNDHHADQLIRDAIRHLGGFGGGE